jgi:hypothetical protein
MPAASDGSPPPLGSIDIAGEQVAPSGNPLLAELQIALISYFYHRARMCLADKYAATWHSLAETLKRTVVATPIGECWRRWPDRA